MRNFKNRFNYSIGVLFLLIGALPFWGSAFGKTGAGKVGAIPTACPVIKGRKAMSAPITVYQQLEKHPLVTWDTLAHFPYDSPDIDEEIEPKLRSKRKKYSIPDFIQQLNGTPIAVYGFMIPLDTDEKGEKATTFILARSQATCCYGITPLMNEWMYVQMAKGKQAEILMDDPVTVFGTIDIGEIKDKDKGWSLYRMVSDKVIIPKTQNW
jgi:hypothetical protein